MQTMTKIIKFRGFCEMRHSVERMQANELQTSICKLQVQRMLTNFRKVSKEIVQTIVPRITA